MEVKGQMFSLLDICPFISNVTTAILVVLVLRSTNMTVHGYISNTRRH